MKSNTSEKCILLIYLLPDGSCKRFVQDSALDDKEAGKHWCTQHSDWATGCMTRLLLSEASRQVLGPQNYAAYRLRELIPQSYSRTKVVRISTLIDMKKTNLYFCAQS